jgi:hypothetical protein
MCQNIPDWIVYLLMAYPVLVHLRTLAPPQAQGALTVVFAILDAFVGNYKNCKNAPIDLQHIVTKRPGV